MKSLSATLTLLLFDTFLLCSASMAQDWSEPIPVTSGLGDDHHVTCLYGDWSWPEVFKLAWERTENGNTDIYVSEFDLLSGVLAEEIRVTNQSGQDVHPQFIYATDPPGVVFQSDQSGQQAI